LGQPEPGVVAALLGLLDDEDARVRESAARALGELEQAEPGVVNALVDLLGNAMNSVTAAFRRLRNEPQVVSTLLIAIGNPDEAIRTEAALALDIGSEIIFHPEKDPTITPQHAIYLIPMLDSQIEVNYSSVLPFLEGYPARKIKDVAWDLLRHYSKETGEHIYWNSEET
jgi:hypothetical protein